MSRNLTYVVSVLAHLAIATPILAQSPLQSAKSDGAIALDTGKFIQLNLAQSQFSIAYLRTVYPSIGDSRRHGDFAYGMQVGLKPATNGHSATLYNLGQDDLAVGGNVELTLSINHLLSYILSTKDLKQRNKYVDDLKTIADRNPGDAGAKAEYLAAVHRGQQGGPGSLDYDSLAIRVGFRHDQYNLVSNVTGIGSTTRNQIFDGLYGSLAYSAQFGYKTGTPCILAISVGEQAVNNSGDLTSVQVQKPLINGSNGIATVKNTAALFGNYAQSSSTSFDLDFIVKPKSLDRQFRLGLDLLLRSDYATTKGRLNPGIAAFISPPGKPLEIQAAVVALYNNSTKKAEINLVAGFNF